MFSVMKVIMDAGWVLKTYCFKLRMILVVFMSILACFTDIFFVFFIFVTCLMVAHCKCKSTFFLNELLCIYDTWCKKKCDNGKMFENKIHSAVVVQCSYACWLFAQRTVRLAWKTIPKSKIALNHTSNFG